VISIFYWHSILSVKNVGNKLLEQRINIKLLVTWEKMPTMAI